ncbi:MAG: putative baseplate assembly protein [Pseudoxanthomonas sp.]
MTRLAPNLFDRRFDDLVEAGRSRLPTLAPAWTDYNAHDPGITLLELLAWVTEAQLYSLSRMRRDERKAYAAMFGISPQGSAPAGGSVWPELGAPDAPMRSHRQSLVIGADARIAVSKGEVPAFHPTHPILWVPGGIVSLSTRLGDGGSIDQTAVNASAQHGFEPFGPDPGPGTRLRMEFETVGTAGLFPKARETAVSALFPIGVRVEGSVAAGPPLPVSPLLVSLIGPEGRFPVPVVSDTSGGMLRSGVLLLDVGAVTGSPERFALEFEPNARLGRAPRILALQPGVIPVEQGASIENEVHVATREVDQRVRLEVPGLRHGAGVAPLRVRVVDASEDAPWSPVDDLDVAGPDDRVYVLDAEAETIRFGNGINGRMPSSGAQIVLAYPVSDGAAGNTGRRKQWNVQGIEGAFGTNLDPMAGGRDALDDHDRRREARQRLRFAHALVNSTDIEAAVLALADLDVGHARVLPAQDRSLVRVVAMRRSHASASASPPQPESAAWLEAIRMRLAPRMPLGARLQVQAPQYVGFSVRARLQAASRHDPRRIGEEAMRRLTEAFAPVAGRGSKPSFGLGIDVSPRDIAAQLRQVAGVARVESVVLHDASGSELTRLAVPARGLAWLDTSASALEVVRPASGAGP